MRRTGLALFAFAFLALPARAGLKPGFTPNVPVTAPTRLDWTFAATNRTLANPPADLLDKDYDSTKQSFDLYLPVRRDPKKPIPAVLFISSSNDASGWAQFQPVCIKNGIAFIAVRGAGNGTPTGKRVRVVLDCFDEVRRQVPLDPDRTYVSGISGGGRMACVIGFSLPEYFGGILPLAAGGELRDESWLRHRAFDRLSAALITGQTDFNRGEVEMWKGPMWKEIGIRAKVWVQPKLGHGIANSATLGQAIAWLEEDKTRRAALAKKYPASRAEVKGALGPKELAEALTAEAKEKLADSRTLYAGLMLLKGVSERFPDLGAGEAARKRLEEYDARKERPWDADDIAEQRRFLIAEARALSEYALKGMPAGSPYLKSRPELAKSAIDHWNKVIADAPDSEAAKDGQKRLKDLEPLTKK